MDQEGINEKKVTKLIRHNITVTHCLPVTFAHTRTCTIRDTHHNLDGCQERPARRQRFSSSVPGVDEASTVRDEPL